MGGSVLTSGSVRPGEAGTDPDLFSDALVVSDPHFQKSKLGWKMTLVLHVVGLALVILLPVFWPQDLPEVSDLRVRLMYNPPPPPPPPLPKGASSKPQLEPAKPTTPDPKPQEPKFTAPETPKEEPKEVQPEDKAKMEDQFGSESGSDFGDVAGMEGGVEGGVVGGVIGGVLGGVVGGTGDGPVLDYDQAPRAIKITRPQYPQEAFVKKIEGKVLVEILIDANGNVIRARVLQSVPLLDNAAIQTVYQWRFTPAMKHGRPVAALAHAPVDFRIF
jgi:protein TonB